MIKKIGKIKIISGFLKGRNIYINKNINVRPTLHRIRETLFNWLSNKINNSTCLDCFSGSGALSIESISRHAKFVTLLEKNKKIIQNIKENIQSLNIKNINIINIDTLKWLKKKYNTYDIIFLDPPYFEHILQKSIFLINQNSLIKKNGYIYIEKYRNQKIYYPQEWYLYKKKNTLNIDYELYIYTKNK